MALSNYLAFLLRFDGYIPEPQRSLVLPMLPSLLLIRGLVFLPLRRKQGLWRYTSVWDLGNILVGVVTSSVVFYLLVHQVMGITEYLRSIFILDSLLLVFFMCGVRMTRRVFREIQSHEGKRSVLVYGAGDAGEMIVRDMRQNGAFAARPVGFLDDDYRKIGERIHGVPVLGTRENLASVIEQTKAEEVLIAIPSAPPDVLRAIVRELESFKVRISTLPRLADLVRDQVGVHQIRQLKVEDLLAREPIALDYGPVRDVLSGKRVLVTGAGGSIGSELCRQIAQARPELLLLLDRYENTLFHVHNELGDTHPTLQTECVIADITDAPPYRTK